MSQDELQHLKFILRDFAEERDWEQFHSPKNLSMALIAEAAELVEHFQWLSESESRIIQGDKLENKFLPDLHRLLFLKHISHSYAGVDKFYRGVLINFLSQNIYIYINNIGPGIKIYIPDFFRYISPG